MTKKIGITLIIISFAKWVAIPALIFIAISAAWKVALGTTIAVLGEALFWTGTVLLGKDLYKKYFKSFSLKEWLRKKKGN